MKKESYRELRKALKEKYDLTDVELDLVIKAPYKWLSKQVKKNTLDKEVYFHGLFRFKRKQNGRRHQEETGTS